MHVSTYMCFLTLFLVETQEYLIHFIHTFFKEKPHGHRSIRAQGGYTCTTVCLMYVHCIRTQGRCACTTVCLMYVHCIRTQGRCACTTVCLMYVHCIQTQGRCACTTVCLMYVHCTMYNVINVHVNIVKHCWYNVYLFSRHQL